MGVQESPNRGGCCGPRSERQGFGMRAPRALAGIAVLLSLAGACAGDSSPEPVVMAVAPTSSTTATTVPTTTTAPPAPPVRAVRASRSLVRPRPAPAEGSAPAGQLPPVMLRIRWCESRDNYQAQNRSSTASGAWQFLDSSWANYAGYPRAWLAPPDVQDQKALNVYNAVGTRPWNASRRCWG